MAFLLRVDIDKPFGHHTFWRKIASKLKENFWFPNFFKFGYLSHYKEFLIYCNDQGVSGHLYHRLCTIPDGETKKMILAGNHHYGFHAENTKSLESFIFELKQFSSLSENIKVSSFSKHGSGVKKLGKNHYPKYEPEKYKKWSSELCIRYPFGNGSADSKEDLLKVDNWFENQFWMEPSYRKKNFNKISQLIEFAKNNDVVILIHPCNFKSDKKVMDDFKKIVDLSKENEIEWILIN